MRHRRSSTCLGICTVLALVGPGCASSGPAHSTASATLASEPAISTSIDSDDTGGRSSCFVDVHTHVIGVEPGLPDWANVAKAGAEAIGAMDDLGITTSIVMLPPAAPDSPIRDIDYNVYSSLAEQWPERFAILGGGSLLNPLIQEIEASEVTEQNRKQFRDIAEGILASGLVAGFGELTALHLSLFEGHPFEEAPPDHPFLLELADVAAENDVPIDLHMEIVARDALLDIRAPGAENPETVSGNLEGFERLLRHNPKAEIVLQHVGADHIGDTSPEVVAGLLQNHPNLTVALKSVDGGRAVVHQIVAGNEIEPEWLEVIAAYSDRFVIGSDHFYRLPGSTKTTGDDFVEPSANIIELLPDDLAEQVACDNPTDIYL